VGWTRGYAFFINNGLLGLEMADGTTSTFLTSSAAVAAGSWTHVGVTVNRHSATGGVFYVNGAPVSTFDPRPRNHSITNTSPLRVACDSLTGGSCYQGGVDEVVAYARALTAQEMQAIFAAQGKGTLQAVLQHADGRLRADADDDRGQRPDLQRQRCHTSVHLLVRGDSGGVMRWRRSDRRPSDVQSMHEHRHDSCRDMHDGADAGCAAIRVQQLRRLDLL